MGIVFSEPFSKAFHKLPDEKTRLRIIDMLKKIEENPEMGKPLRYQWKNHRSVRIPPFRIIYSLAGEDVIIHCFDHRKDVYD